ncbi:Isoleucine--tRNA ligase, chloroplastic/mitochondrial [Asimina triloba]
MSSPRFIGTSWAAVLEKRDGFCGPADLYLEGSDQHRGWFQSSLLTSIATRGRAPYSSVITHGFVLDEKGLKMSKSLGNVVDPKIVIEGEKNNKDAPGYGADVLRLWVSSVDYTVDVMLGPQILRQISEMYRKLRGTFRYLLSVLPDWKPEYTIPFSELPMIDQHALFQLGNVVNNIKGSYENYQFYRIFQSIQHFAIVDLSNFYFDVAKDRLYTGGTKSFTRRSCQTVLAAHLLSLVRVISPILPHLAEDVWQHLPFEHIMEDGSVAKFVFESRWPDVHEKWLTLPAEQVDFWGGIRELRTEVNKVLEIARGEKLIGSSLDAKVYLHTSNDDMAARLQEMCAAHKDADKLHHIFITSQAEVLHNLANEVTSKVPYSGQCLIQGKTNIWIGVAPADGDKCERCWHYSPQVGSFSEHPTLCGRCYDVVGCHPVAAMAAGKRLWGLSFTNLVEALATGKWGFELPTNRISSAHLGSITMYIQCTPWFDHNVTTRRLGRHSTWLENGAAMESYYGDMKDIMNIDREFGLVATKERRMFEGFKLYINAITNLIMSITSLPIRLCLHLVISLNQVVLKQLEHFIPL